MQREMMRRRKQAATDREAEDPVLGGDVGMPQLPPQPWYTLRVGKCMIFALLVFFAMHLLLWKVVYDFIMAEDHGKLHGHAVNAWSALKGVLDHL